jgi:ATP-dependent helicase/nuclease subunit A
LFFVPDLERGAPPDEPPLLRAQVVSLPERDPALLLAPIAARGAEQDAIYSWMECLDKERARFERDRVLYVAATRAMRELHLFGALERKDDEIVKPVSGTFLHSLWRAVAHEFVAKTPLTNASSNASISASENALAATSDSVYTRRLTMHWQIPQPQQSSIRAIVTDIIENEPLRPEFEWVGETGRRVGTLVHREIERIAKMGIATASIASIQANRTRYEVLLAELGLPPAMRSMAAERVIAALSQLLRDERGRWLLAGNETHREAASEFALSGIVGTDLVNGIIDRTLVDNEGTRWIIDFKTSSHEGGGLDAFLDSEVERYRPQLHRYAQLMRGYDSEHPIRAALYFPLLSAWREIEVV